MKEITVLADTAIEGLKSRQLPAMASGLAEQREHPDHTQLRPEGQLVLV